MKKEWIALSVVILLSFLISSPASSQTEIGIRVKINSDVNLDDFYNELNLIKTLDIKWIEFEGRPNSEILQSLNYLDAAQFILSEEQFITSGNIINYNDLSRKLTGLVNEFSGDSLIDGISLLRNSQTYDPEFQSAFKIIVDSLRLSSNKTIIAHNSVFEEEMPNYDFLDDLIADIKDLRFIPSDFSKVMLNKSEYELGDERIINEIISNNPELIIFHASWLNEAIELNPDLLTILQDFNTQAALLPLPVEESSFPNSNWNVMVLMVLWITIITHFAYHPNYRENAFRYFYSHNYFVKDIMEYRIRNTSNGLIILIQHAVTGGLFFYYVFRASFSDTGLKAFFENLPYITFIGDTFLSVFILGILGVTIFQITAIIWVSLVNKEIKHSSQILSLYSWPLQLNFLILTVMAVLFQTNDIGILFYVLAVSFIINWFNAFNLAAIDTARFKMGGRLTYTIYTVVLHLIATVTALTLLYLYTPISDAVDLAFKLP